MLRLRRFQENAFARVALDGFEQRMAESVRASFPIHADVLGPEGTLRLVRHAERLAEDHGIVHERGVEEILWLCILPDPGGEQPSGGGEPNLMGVGGNKPLLSRHYRWVLKFLNDHAKGDLYETLRRP